MLVQLAQLDRAFGYEPRGRGFESLIARHYRQQNSPVIRAVFVFRGNYSFFHQTFTEKSQDLLNFANIRLKTSIPHVIQNHRDGTGKQKSLTRKGKGSSF